MRTNPIMLSVLAGALGLLLAPWTGRGGTVPYSESFESYTNGHPIAQVADWTASPSVVVSTNATVVGALTNTALFPLPGAHEKVLELGGATTNALASATGGVVVLDLLVMPARRTFADADPTAQLAAYVATNGRLVIWHENRTNAPASFSEWRELTNSPVLATNEWARLTVRMDQANSLYQVRLNGAEPLVDDAGWTSNNGARPGPWFHMAQTNHAVAQMGTLGDVVSYLDDWVVTQRSLGFSTNGFTEAEEAGFIDTNTPLIIALAWDTFAATNNEDLALDPDKLWVTNLPAGLAVSARVTSPSQLTVSVTGQAIQNETADSVSNLTFAFGSAAFVLGQAWDVAGASTTNLVVRFRSATTAILSYDNTVFVERAANDGGLSGSAAITLTVKDFAGTNTEDLAAGGRVTSSNLPPGLAVSVIRTGPRAATLTLEGQASAHAATHSLANLNMVFGDNAFADGIAATVSNAARSDLQLVFHDPPTLSYAPAVFTERGDDAGVIGNTVAVTLAGDDFAVGPFQSNAQYTVTGVPEGLTFALERNSASLLVGSLAGQATAHSNGNDTAIGLTLLGAAFQTVAASNVCGAVTNLAIDFIDLGPANAVPFTDDFEAYPNGSAIVGTNGWSGAAADSGVVTNAPDWVAAELAYGGRFPLSTTHTRIVAVNNTANNRLRSVAGRPVFLDCMAYMHGRSAAPDAGSDDQLGLYVDTNQRVVIWHQNRTGAPSNEWRVIMASHVTTSAWHRVTVIHDYRHAMFKIKVDGVDLRDDAGWSGPGGTPPGPWFHMTQTNGFMSEVILSGGKVDRPVPVDDVSVTYEDPMPQGATFLFR